MSRAIVGVLLLSSPVNGQKSQAFIFRHCLRQSSDKAKHAKPEFPFLHQYTSKPLPEWGVPDYWCTEGGIKTATAAGADLMVNFGVEPAKTSITADTSMRDGDTAVAMITGMKARLAVEYDPYLYSTIGPVSGDPVCEAPDTATIAADIKARFAEVPFPWPLEEAMDEFEAVFGVGPAGSMRELGNISVAEDGTLLGPVNIMKELSKNLLYSTASGIKYLDATYEQATRFIAWQHYSRSVKSLGTKQAVESSWLLKRTLNDLFSKKDHSTLHFGHDGNIDGFAAFWDLEWEAAPFMGGKLLPTPPNSALRLVHDHATGDVTASFIHIPFDKDVSQSAFVESPIAIWPKHDFMTLTAASLERFPGAKQCFDSAPGSDVLSSFSSVMV